MMMPKNHPLMEEENIFKCPPLSFKMDHRCRLALSLKSSVSQKLRQFLGNYSDDVLAEYIVVLVCNGKNQNQAQEDLEAFLGEESGAFVEWMWSHLSKTIEFPEVPISSECVQGDTVSAKGDSSANKHSNGGQTKSHGGNNKLLDSYPELISSNIREDSIEGKRGKTNNCENFDYNLVENNWNEDVKTDPRPVRSSSKYSASPDRCLQYEDHFKKSLQKDQARKNLESAVGGNHCAKATRLPVRSSNSSVPNPSPRPRGNVWDRLGKPVNEASALNGEITTRFIDMVKRTAGHDENKAMLATSVGSKRSLGEVTVLDDNHCEKAISSCGTMAVDACDDIGLLRKRRRVDEISSANDLESLARGKCIVGQGRESTEIKRLQFNNTEAYEFKNKEGLSLGLANLSGQQAHPEASKIRRARLNGKVVASALQGKSEVREVKGLQCNDMIAYESRNKEGVSSRVADFSVQKSHPEVCKFLQAQCGKVAVPALQGESEEVRDIKGLQCNNIVCNESRKEDGVSMGVSDSSVGRADPDVCKSRQALWSGKVAVSAHQGKSEALILSVNGDPSHKPIQAEVMDVKLRLRQIELEMSKLRAKQAGITNDVKPTVVASGARNILIHSEEDIDSRTVFITNVHFAATKEALSLHFSTCGMVSKVVLLTDVMTGQPKGSAYVVFMSKEAADKALAMNGTSVYSRTLKIVRKKEAVVSVSTPPLLLQLPGKPSQPQTLSRPQKKPTPTKPYSTNHLQWRRDTLTSCENDPNSCEPSRVKGGDGFQSSGVLDDGAALYLEYHKVVHSNTDVRANSETSKESPMHA
ncbi:uncharacterized protein LOC18440792 [Amborella trichopoda]|nr:uncharacterized protein LOC18440792 [Amborella trichopoda]|eukprot:XP_006850993.2 uncharacterized protein LOC18440792 [Amborella trichopoda]